jgi:hypothetical protein
LARHGISAKALKSKRGRNAFEMILMSLETKKDGYIVLGIRIEADKSEIKID